MKKRLTKAQRVLFGAAAACVLAGAAFGLLLRGYLTTALVFFGTAAVLCFFGALAPKRTRAARRARWAMAAALLVGLGCFLAAEVPVLRDARSDEDVSAPYLIVCGAGVNGSEPSLSMVERLRAAEDWLAAQPEGVAILSGSQGRGEDLSEARAMYEWLTGRGLDPDRLILEEQADNSRENIANSLAIIAQRGGDPAGRVAILSSDYHLHRLRTMAQRQGCQPVMVAARSTWASLFVNYAIREAAAMWKLWLLGT